MESFKHLNLDERLSIEYGLTIDKSVREIAGTLNRTPSTILREIKRNLIVKGFNRTRECARIVCNGCNRRKYCGQKKIYYSASSATSAYRSRLSECRVGPYIKDENFDYINDLLKEKIINQNQSIFMVLISDKHLREITSESSLRRYIDRGFLEVKNHHLKQVKKRKVKKKKALKSDTEFLSKERAKYRYLRTFSFFKKYLKEHPNASVVEFDSVIGKRSDKYAILTIYFRKYNFQIGLLIEKGNPYSVIEKVKELFSKFDEETLKRLFEVCLCDNGSEFSFFPELEINEDGEQFIHTFYTRPNTSTDKAGCERNHRELRDILPKHKSFDGLSQEDLNKIFSHVNSKVRKKLKGKSPFSIMVKGEGLEIIKKLKIKRISKKKVRLSPVI